MVNEMVYPVAKRCCNSFGNLFSGSYRQWSISPESLREITTFFFFLTILETAPWVIPIAAAAWS